ncbi:MAG: glutamate-1-semialdehyde 2,1-aminomutase [Actinobacteria bacterium]|nr:glutamate-1-semialdehyde 2,1-aminomutase [Actinomycetota bacterium]
MSPSTDLSNEAWFARAQAVIPGGVDSPVRSFSSVGGTPFTVASGSGGTVTDVEGKTYIDLVQSYGASLLGHAHPKVIEAIREAALKGSTFGAPTRGEVLLAEAITQRVAGLEQIRLVSSGTEAVMSAVRLARGFTGRDLLVKFDGCYHGHADHLLAGGGSGVATLGLPGSAGVPSGAVADTLVLPYNQVPELSSDVAAVLVEAVACNMNLVRPVAGFLEGLRAECDRVGALLIFDEVITGFRLGEGGAQAHFSVTPDLWTFGKVIGGGLPAGAFGGKAEVLRSLAPQGPVYQAGTLSGNPLATAAGVAVLSEVGPRDYLELTQRAQNFGRELCSAIREGGLWSCVPAEGPLLGLYLAADGNHQAPSDYEGAKALCSSGIYAGFFHGMLRRGVFLAPGAYEVMFVSLAHTPEQLASVVAAAGESAAEVVASRS